MDIEYLEYDCEVIDLDDNPASVRDAQADEAAVEAVFASWFTDWRNRNAAEPNTGAN